MTSPLTRLSRYVLLSCCLSLGCANLASAEETLYYLHDDEHHLNLEWRGSFTAAQQRMLRQWLHDALIATTCVTGAPPLPVLRIILEARPNSGEPVPFARVLRGEQQGVHFLVDPAESAAAFRNDWTAVHELSHLFIPYPGARGTWLAEGLATYYQNVIQARAGILAPQQAWQKLYEGFVRGVADTGHEGISLEQLSPQMWRRGAYMRVYWSGTAFFLQADTLLRQASGNAQTLDTVLTRYQQCCRPAGARITPEDLIAGLDRAAGRPLFSALYARYCESMATPDPATLLQGVALAPDSGQLHTVAGNSLAAQIRDAIMAPQRQGGG